MNDKVVKYIKKFLGETMNMKKPNGEEIISFLNKKWKGTTCPLCNGQEWNVADKIFELREFNGGNVVIGSGTSLIPVIPVTCENCGNTVFINVISTGLMKE